MRALWSGVIQFGLVVLPVKLYSATEEHKVRLREIHAADSGRVQHRRFCEAEDREIPYADGGQLAAPPEPGPAVDLMAALEESVRAALAHHGG
ncbi:Ku protein [Streptomyces sp. NPDC058287]|uniref:Ku protein n=1 Tax=unclassified Streptomyces TaxID=2593676 RepID=UPI0036E0B840